MLRVCEGFAPTCGGWPYKMAGVLEGPEVQEETVAQFYTDTENFKKLKALGNRDAKQDEMLMRSLFQTVRLQQFREMFAETRHEVTREVKDLILRSIQICYGTQIVEDIGNMEKNQRPSEKASQEARHHYRRPESAWATGISKGIVEKQHRYEAIEACAPTSRHNVSLANSVWSGRDGSLPFEEIVTTAQKAPYWSPTPFRTCIPCLDLYLLDYVVKTHAMMQLDQTWQNFFVDYKCTMVFRKLCGLDKGWYWGWWCHEETACFAWPVDVLCLQLRASTGSSSSSGEALQ